MENPKDMRYTKEHEWVKVEGETATVGITHHAQELLTDIVFVELPDKGKQVEQGKQLCVVESVKSVSDVFAPLSGEVTDVNTSLDKNPEKVNEDAFGEGWLAKLKVKDEKELDNLMTTEEYDKYVQESH